MYRQMIQHSCILHDLQFVFFNSSFIFVFLMFHLAKNIVRQVVEGLMYLHSHNILHRDISLPNLLLTKDLRVVSSFRFHLVKLFLRLSHKQFRGLFEK